ncbi:hypothetical protein JTB14_019805 [Gonioctena quinquepunctata]|nr:hypothetical protein JTB14_019805 [Gonioctena quinquepunctata]
MRSEVKKRGTLKPLSCLLFLVAVSIGRQSILSPELEEDLVAYCLEMDRRFYGHGLGDINRFTYQLAIRNGLRHHFSHESGAACEKWLKGFLKRNQNLSIE